MGELAMAEDGGRDIGDPASRSHGDTLVGCRRATQSIPVRSKIHSSQFPDQNRPVDGHRSQPDAKSRNQNFGFAPPKPRLNPGQAAAAQGENDQRPALSPVERKMCRQVFRIF